MTNTPYKVVDPETQQEKTIWESRSVAVAAIIFAKNIHGIYHVLVNKRGEGVPDFKGYWNCPCGYLDYDEDTRDAAVREVYEETGLKIDKSCLKLITIDDNPKSNRQNVTIIYSAILDGIIENDWLNFSLENMEKDEVEWIQWLNINALNLYKMAFNHDKLIKICSNRTFKMNWFKKLLYKIGNKLISYAHNS